MLDIKFIRENKELVEDGARKKHIDIDVAHLLEIDEKRRKLLTSVEEKRAQHNRMTKKISEETDPAEREKIMSSTKEFKEKLQEEEKELQEITKEWQRLMLQVPNVPDISVPEGKSDEENEEIKTWGKIPKFDFAFKNHIDLMLEKNMVDFERGSKVAGFRGYFLKNDGATLMFAIWHFVYEQFLKRGGFTPVVAPSLVQKEHFMGTGFLPQGEEDLYKTQDDTYLAGTAEVPMMGYHMDEKLEISNLPEKFIAFSPCFRREAGSYGRDTKGLMRVHEFFKFEQVVFCEASHEESVRQHEALTNNSEEIMKMLSIPYRVVINCGGDLGLGQVKKYDIEAWVPSENKYRETHSSSYFHDFQARRLNIKYEDKYGETHFCHTLNNTAIVTPRILISILENNQREDGSIEIPEALRSYMEKDAI